MNTTGVFYSEKIIEKDSRGMLKYNTQLVNCIEEACQYCIDTSNSIEEPIKPIMMLGRIQSGKTRAYIGLISLAFDNDFDFILVLSKNSRALVTQTERRMKEEFRKFIDCGDVVVKNIQDMDDKKLKKYQLKQKQIVIAKKETRNLDRIERFIADNDINDKKKCLIIDDEADITSVGFTKIKGIDEFELRTISDKINNIRGSLSNCVFVQVTATPYALYLQSTSYEGVLADHRVVILLQITQGMLETFNFKNIKKEKEIFEEVVSRVKKHQNIAHAVSKNVSQQESDLLKLIAGDDDIVNLLKQTRDCLSHFTPKENRLHNYQLVAIKKIFLVELRIFVLEQIGIKNFNIDNIAEYYLSIFDWIKIDIKNEHNYKPMSMIYKIRIGRKKSTYNNFN